MIELDEFEIPQRDYFRVLFRRRIEKLAWFLAYYTIYWCAYLIVYDDWLTFSICLLFGYTLLYGLIYMSTRKVVFNSGNDTLFQKQKITFEGQMFHAITADGAETRAPVDSRFIRAEKMHDYYLLYFDRYSGSLLPFAAFRSGDDKKRFEMEILGDKLKNRTISKKKIVVFLVISIVVVGLACLLRSPERIEMLKKERLEQQNRIDLHAE